MSRQMRSPFLSLAVAALLLPNHRGGRVALTAPSDSTRCYAFHFGTWTSPDSTTFAAAPAGLQMPMPDTVGLSQAVSRMNYGRSSLPWRTVLTPPSDSSHTGGVWFSLGPDTLVLRFPPSYGWVLQLRLAVDREGLKGFAGVGPAQSSDSPRFNPAAPVTGVRIACPAVLKSRRSGA